MNQPQLMTAQERRQYILEKLAEPRGFWQIVVIRYRNRISHAYLVNSRDGSEAWRRERIKIQDVRQLDADGLIHLVSKEYMRAFYLRKTLEEPTTTTSCRIVVLTDAGRAAARGDGA